MSDDYHTYKIKTEYFFDKLEKFLNNVELPDININLNVRIKIVEEKKPKAKKSKIKDDT